MTTAGRGRVKKRVIRTHTTNVTRAAAQPFVQHAFAGRIEFFNGQRIPTVLMTRGAYSRMWHFVDLAKMEVSWLGTVRLLPNGNYLIEEVFLLEQEVSAVTTALSVHGQANLVQDLIDSRPDGMEAASRLLFWGHSHVNMGTAPSAQDEEQVEEFRENGCPWFIRAILNKKGRMEFTLFLWEARLKIVDVPWAVYEEVDGSFRASIEAEFREKVFSAARHSVAVGVDGDHYLVNYAQYGRDMHDEYF